MKDDLTVLEIISNAYDVPISSVWMAESEQLVIYQPDDGSYRILPSLYTSVK